MFQINKSSCIVCSTAGRTKSVGMSWFSPKLRGWQSLGHGIALTWWLRTPALRQSSQPLVEHRPTGTSLLHENTCTHTYTQQQQWPNSSACRKRMNTSFPTKSWLATPGVVPIQFCARDCGYECWTLTATTKILAFVTKWAPLRIIHVKWIIRWISRLSINW